MQPRPSPVLILPSLLSQDVIYGKKASLRATSCHWHCIAVQGDGRRNEGEYQSWQHFFLQQRSHLGPNDPPGSSLRYEIQLDANVLIEPSLKLVYNIKVEKAKTRKHAKINVGNISTKEAHTFQWD